MTSSRARQTACPRRVTIRQFAVDDTLVIKSGMVLNSRVGYAWQTFPQGAEDFGVDLAAIGFVPSVVGLYPTDIATFPQVGAGPSYLMRASSSVEGLGGVNGLIDYGTTICVRQQHAELAGREPQPADGARVAAVSRAEPRVTARAHARLRHHVDARPVRQLDRRAVRPGAGVVPDGVPTGGSCASIRRASSRSGASASSFTTTGGSGRT